MPFAPDVAADRVFPGCEPQGNDTAWLPAQADVDFPINIAPLFGLPQEPEQLFKPIGMIRGELEPCQEIKWFAELATVMEPTRDGWQVLQTQLDMVRAFLNDLPALVLTQFPPGVDLANGYERGANRGGPIKSFLFVSERGRLIFAAVANISGGPP